MTNFSQESIAKHKNCSGCAALGWYQNEHVCTNLVQFHPADAVPEDPFCFEIPDKQERQLRALELRAKFKLIPGFRV